MITVLGSAGVIGSEDHGRRGFEYQAPARDEPLDGRPLGNVVYCVGVTGDFRHHPLDTVDAHGSHLATLLCVAQVDSLVYLSSTRVYRSGPPDLYNLSKALGEALAQASGTRY